jgi:hypothetical protein
MYNLNEARKVLLNNMKKITTIVILCFLFLSKSLAQKAYILDLKPVKWDIKTTVFYIDSVIDDRTVKKNAGEVLSDGKKIPAQFPHSLEQDIKSFLDQSLDKNVSAVPVAMVFERFELNETGNMSNHKANLNYQIKFFRIKGDKRLLLFETSGNPYLSMKGPYPNPNEKNIASVLKSTINTFNDWISKNSDIPPFVDSVRVVFDPEPKYSDYVKGDTISWNKNYKLNWNDFKGKIRVNTYMAESNCIFTYRAEPKISNRKLTLHIRMNACFDRMTSWVKDDQKKDPLLRHEQLHFDICELHIRNLKKLISEAKFDPLEFDKQIQTLFDKEWELYQAEQEKYDDETEHGINKEKQEKWESRILSLLMP